MGGVSGCHELIGIPILDPNVVIHVRVVVVVVDEGNVAAESFEVILAPVGG